MSEIGIGIIGCGGMGSWHADNVDRQPGLRVVAAADLVPRAAAAVADRLGAEVRDGHDAIASDDVHAVLIASTDDTHAEYAVAAIEAGKPCFLEKPLGTTMAHAQAILDAERGAGRRLVRVGFMRELDPAHAEVEAALAELGPITRVRSVHRNVDPEHRDIDTIFSQSLIHDIHTIRWLSGDEIIAVRSHVVDRPDGHRDIHLVCQLAGGGLGLVDFEDQAFAYEVQVEVTAVGGIVSTVPHPRTVVKRSGTERLAVGADWFGRFAEAYRLEIEQWAATLQAAEPGDSPQGPSVWDGFAAQAVAVAAQQSILGRCDVVVETPARPALYSAARP